MISRTRATFLAFLLLVPLAGCGRDRLKVGSKDFTENILLGEMVALLAEEQNISVERKLSHGSSFACLHALEHDDLDIYVDYSGTLLALKGKLSGAETAEQAWKNAQNLARDNTPPLVWGNRLGFNNSFTLWVRPEMARKHGLQAISDLEKLNRPIRFAYDEEFRRRPIDGLTPMLARYGLERDEESIQNEDEDVLARALERDEVDVLVDTSTSGQAAEFGWLALTDDAHFFPPYEAAPLARKQIVDQFPELKQMFKDLSGLLTEEEVRERVKEIDIYGADPREVARNFLIEKDLLKATQPKETRKPLTLGVLPGSDLDAQQKPRSHLLKVALRAVRKANAGRRVDFAFFPNVPQAIASNEAFMGVMGAENFFSFPGLQRIDKVQAIAVLGYHVAHVFCLPDRTDQPFTSFRRLGVGLEDGQSARAGEMLRAMFPVQEGVLVHGKFEDQLKALREKKLDAVLLMEEEGSPRVETALSAGKVVLLSLARGEESEQELTQQMPRFPFLRRVRIDKDTYSRMTGAVETVGAQVVLVGPVPEEVTLGAGSPSSAVRGERQAIPLLMRRALYREIGLGVEIDPNLPGHEIETGGSPRAPLNPAPMVSGLTFLFFAIFGYFLWALGRTRPS
jgi:osmoprotectant transport system substrate-binding protein